jgi:radical SAM protein with 4Fe4S-binding SPASM domain
MSESVWSELMPIARRTKQVWIAGFGEPLTNPRCLDLLQQLDDEGIRTTFVTNGLALNPRIASRLASLQNLVHINVSIDSPDPTIYRHIRGGSLDRALRGLNNLIGSVSDTSRITVSSVAMRDNIGTLADFPPVLARMGIKTYVVQGLNDYTDYSKGQRLSGADDLAEHISRLRSACTEWGIDLALTTPERTDAEQNQADGVLRRYFYDLGATATKTRQCMLPWELPYIDKDGRVFPCCIAASASESQLGQLGQPDKATLMDVWNGKAYQDFRQALLDHSTTPAVCRNCTIVPAGTHPLRAYRATLIHINRKVSRDGIITVRFRNTGTETWAGPSIRVGTAMPRDRSSRGALPAWVSNNRPCSFKEQAVAPGEIATFTFQIDVAAGRSLEHFQLVADGTCWLPNTQFSVETPRAIRQPIRALRRIFAGARRAGYAQACRTVVRSSRSREPRSGSKVGLEVERQGPRIRSGSKSGVEV